MSKVDKPQHEQISDWLRNAINSGEYTPLDRLPSESELGDRFGVSRVTVRHALQTLENDGLIHRRQGLGSFVSKKSTPGSMIQLHDFSEELARAGLPSRSKVIEFKTSACPPDIAEMLELEVETPVLYLERVRLAEDLPVACDFTWLPMFYGQLLEDRNLENQTIYTILEKHYQIPILNGRYNLKAESANKTIADHLEIEKNRALLLIDRLSCTTRQKKVYYQKRYYRTDRLSYEIYLERTEEQWSENPTEDSFPLKKFTPVFKPDKD